MLVIVVKTRVVHHLVNDVCTDPDGVPYTRNRDVSPCYVVKKKLGKWEYLFGINLVELGNLHKSHNL